MWSQVRSIWSVAEAIAVNVSVAVALVAISNANVALVDDPAPLVAVSVIEKLPVSLGVPVIVNPEMLSPVGKDPEARVSVGVYVPDTYEDKSAVYETPLVPFARVSDPDHAGATGAVTMPVPPGPAYTEALSVVPFIVI